MLKDMHVQLYMLPARMPSQNEHMAIDVFRFSRVFRFLEQFSHSRHTTAFLKLFYFISHKDMKISFRVNERVLFDIQKPTFTDIGRSPEKIQYGIITSRLKARSRITEVTPSLSERSISPMVIAINYLKAALRKKQDLKQHNTFSIKFSITV